MAKKERRLQVILPDNEMAELRESRTTAARKLKALRKACQNSFPIADIHGMLAEIGQGSQR